jgi:hypothetical protein
LYQLYNVNGEYVFLSKPVPQQKSIEITKEVRRPVGSWGNNELGCMSAIGFGQTNSRRMVPMVNLDPSNLVQHWRKVTGYLPPLTVAAWKSSRTLYLD